MNPLIMYDGHIILKGINTAGIMYSESVDTLRGTWRD